MEFLSVLGVRACSAGRVLAEEEQARRSGVVQGENGSASQD